MASTRLLLVTLGLGVLTGCFLFGEEQGLEPVAEEIPFSFASPTMVQVKKGDTLNKIAEANSVTAADIQAWNGLADDVIEIDQVLIMWTAPPRVVPSQRVVATSSGGGIRSSLRRVLGTPEATPAPVTAMPPIVVGGASEVEEPQPTTLAAVEPRQRGVIDVGGAPVRGSGILGVNLGSSNVDDLARSAQGMQRHDADLGSGGLAGRSAGLQSGGTADTIEMPTRMGRGETVGGVEIPDTPVRAPRLSKPAAKRCLKGPSQEIDENGMATNMGLTVSQINAGMGQISRHAVKCFPRGTQGTYTITAEITVGCDGRVSNVYLISTGVVPSNVTTCVQQTLGYASFPAHAVPDGIGFQSPLKFSF